MCGVCVDGMNFSVCVDGMNFKFTHTHTPFEDREPTGLKVDIAGRFSASFSVLVR